MKEKNNKSDVDAKGAFIKHLESTGLYQSAKVTGKPADITATSNCGDTHYYEIKFTNRTPDQNKTYFGAATLTEWAAALENPKSYWFVIAIKSGNDWIFNQYTPEEFLTIATLPPPKIFFHYDLSTTEITHKKTKSLRMTKDKLNRLIQFYNELKEG